MSLFSRFQVVENSVIKFHPMKHPIKVFIISLRLYYTISTYLVFYPSTNDRQIRLEEKSNYAKFDKQLGLVVRNFFWFDYYSILVYIW